MKKAKQTLTAALAATLATGVVGTVASAAPIDDIYKAAYNAMEKAKSEKTQTAINEARVAINAMPNELKDAKGEFSKQVDQVQQPIYTQIIDLIEKGKKEAKQEAVNEGRKLLVGVEDAYAKTWSADFDTIQQTLVNNATEAVKAAVKSQKNEDITKAEKLVAELKTSENADVKKSVEGMEKDLVEKIDIRVKNIEVKNATTIVVTFSKDIDKNTIGKDNFVVKNGTIRNYVTDTNLVEGKKDAVELTLQSKLDENKKYELTVSGVKDIKGGNLKTSTSEVKYDKKEVASIEFTSKKIIRNGNVRDLLLVKDAAGRDITKEAKLTFECTSDKNILAKDGKVSSSAKIGKEVVVRVYAEDKVVAEEKVTVAENLAQSIVGFTISKEEVDEDFKFADVTSNNKMKVGSNNGILTIFFKDATGNEKNLSGSKIKKIESLDKDIVSITNGKLNAKKEGVATLRVQHGDVIDEIQVEVVNSNVETATLSMRDTSISVAKSNVDKIVRYQMIDTAFGDEPYYKNVSAEVRIWNDRRSTWDVTDAVKVTPQDSVIRINGSKLKNNKDDVSAKLIVTYQNVKYEQEFTINLKDAEKLSSYELVAENAQGKTMTELDQKKTNKQHAWLKVYAIDENDNRISDTITNGSKTTMELYVDGELAAKNDAKKEDFLGSGFDISSFNLEKGDHSYYVRVTRNGETYDTNTVTLTVKNTDDTARNLDVTRNITTGSSLESILSWTYDDQDGSTFDKIDITVTDADATVKVSDAAHDTIAKAFKYASTLRGDALRTYLANTKIVGTGDFTLDVNEVVAQLQIKDAKGNLINKSIEVNQSFDVTVK